MIIARADAINELTETQTWNNQYVTAINSPIIPGQLYESVGNGYCVAFVKVHGFSKFSGNAIEWKKYINSTEPILGSVVVLNEGKVGHLAIVTSVSDETFDLVEQNYSGLYIITERTLSKSYVKILGFITK